MPALECKYSVADDDFVPSSIISTATRFCLFCWILCANAYILVALGSPTGCPNGNDCCNPQPVWLLTMYLFGELLLEFSVMTVSFLILVVSASGTLRERFSDSDSPGMIEKERNGNGAEPAKVNQSRLRTLRLLICTRVVLFFPELSFSVLGLVVAFHPQLLNQPGCESSHIYQLLAAYSIVTTILTFLRVAYYLIAMDPAGCCSPGSIDYIKEYKGLSYRVARGRRKTTQQTLYSNHTTQLWQKRINLLACGSVSGGQNVNSSVLQVARLFSVIFQFPNYTISDIATALALARNEQLERYRKYPLQECFRLGVLREKLIEQLNENEFCPGKAQYKYQRPVAVNLFDKSEFDEVEDAVYFFRYAMAVYGWPLYLFGNPTTGCCKLCCMSLGICCIMEEGCHCNEAAFKLETEMGLTEDNVVHCSGKNELYCSPYKVILDHDQKAVVVAIRGTLSVEDAITSLSVSLTSLLVDEPPYDNLDTQVHKGWYETAEKILDELTKCPNIFKLFNEPKYTDYRLVVVGHSLGGAVAAILSVLIKQRHKVHAHRVKSFGYSTPGCVFTYPLAKYCHDFVTTVVLDNDLLPRMNWRSMLLLRATLKETLETCEKPKHQVLYTDPILAACKKDRPRDRQEEMTEEVTFRAFIHSVYDHPDWKKCLGPFFGEHMSFESTVSAVVKLRIWQKKAKVKARPTEQRFEPNNPRAFLPGRVLQIDTEEERFRPWLPWPKRSRCQLKWVANEDYCQMLLHGGPLSSHLPNNVYTALNMVKKQHLKQKVCVQDSHEILENFTLGRGLWFDKVGEGDLCEQEEAAGTDVDGLQTRVIKVDIEENNA